jgi:hypothetical protein
MQTYAGPGEEAGARRRHLGVQASCTDPGAWHFAHSLHDSLLPEEDRSMVVGKAPCPAEVGDMPHCKPEDMG